MKFDKDLEGLVWDGQELPKATGEYDAEGIEEADYTPMTRNGSNIFFGPAPMPIPSPGRGGSFTFPGKAAPQQEKKSYWARIKEHVAGMYSDLKHDWGR